MIRVEGTRVAPGVVEHGSPFAEIDLTGTDGPRPRLDALAEAFAAAGPATRVLEDETAALWAEMSFLAPFALLTTLPRALDFARPGGTPIGLPLGDVRTRHRDEPAALVEETAAICDACGGPADPVQALARYDAFPAATSCRTGPGARPGADTEPSPPAHPYA